MLARRNAVATASLVSMTLLAQEPSTSRSCAATEEGIRLVAHDFWAAYNHRDAAALEKLLDNRLLFISESGALSSKAQVVAPFRIPPGSMKLESDEQPQNVRTAFVGDMAVMSFTKGFKITHQPTGASFSATSRMTETLVCAGGEWKVIAFQETMVREPARPVYKPAVDHFDDYVGKYRFGEDGRGGEIAVTRQVNRLYESWGTDKPVEILPGKYDVFHTPGFPILERFVRDRRGRVVGIVYTMGDSEVEAKRIQ